MMEMMRQMMAGVVPSGVSPESLRDPQSRGAAFLVSYCTQCHALPSPRMHAATEWPPVVARMTERMRMMARMEGMVMGGIRAPRPQEGSVWLMREVLYERLTQAGTLASELGSRRPGRRPVEGRRR